MLMSRDIRSFRHTTSFTILLSCLLLAALVNSVHPQFIESERQQQHPQQQHPQQQHQQQHPQQHPQQQHQQQEAEQRQQQQQEQLKYVSRSFLDNINQINIIRHQVQHSINFQKNQAPSSPSLQQVMIQDALGSRGFDYSWLTTLGPSRIRTIVAAMNKLLTAFETKEAIIGDRSSCTIDIARLVIGISTGKQWAGSFLDASGKPGPSISRGWVSFVGNYEQCTESFAPPVTSLEPGFRGQYCNLPVVYNIAPFPLNMGMCVPSTCTSQDMTPFFRRVLSLLNVTAITFDDIQCLKSETKVTTATVIAIIILSVMGSLVVLGTCYDIFIVHQDNKKPFELDSEDTENYYPEPSCSDSSNDNRTRLSSSATEQEEATSVNEEKPVIQRNTDFSKARFFNNNNKMSKFLLAFSAYTNAKRVLNPHTPRDSIDVIHGVRFFSTCWVAVGHTFIYGGPGYTINFTTALQTFLQRWTFTVVLNCIFAVDTFFTLSGLLVSYTTIKKLWSRGGLRFNWAMFYFHRYWRLTPPYLCILVIVLGLQQYLGHGALWGNAQPYDKEYCDEHWWTNLLYVHNIVKPTQPCFVHSWYLGAEMQFILISPILLIALCYSKLAGVACFVCVLVASWTITGVLSVSYGWGVTVMSAAQNDWYGGYYTVPWTRIGPYVVGILAGYYLALKNGKPFKIRSWIVVIGWCVAVAAGLAVVYGIEGHYTWMGEVAEEGNMSVKALYNAVSRSVWAACVCWVIIACAAGYGGPVTVLLSWSPLVVLGRLTFLTYLVHIPVLNVFYGNMDSLYFLNDTTFALLYIGLMVVANVVAFLAMMLFESPMAQLEKSFIRTRGSN